MKDAEILRLLAGVYRRFPMGTIVYGEVILPIVRVRLESGQIIFDGYTEDSVTIPGSGEIRLHSSDGTLIATMITKTTGSEKPIRCPDGCHLEFPITARSDSWPRDTP